MILSRILSPIKSKFTNRHGVNHDNVSHRIYGGLVAQARNSALFTDFAIPDTVMGRYDMLGLHVFLINNRLKAADCSETMECSILSQKVFDLFVIDLERGLRDLGFADTSVHKRKKKFVHSYYALIDEFDNPIASGDTGTLCDRIAHRYYHEADAKSQKLLSAKLCDYVLLVAQELGKIDIHCCLSGKISWPVISEEQI